MSIQKWYAVVCDECGEIIQYWQCCSASKAIELSRGNSVRVTNNYQFCCEDCRKKYFNKKNESKRLERASWEAFNVKV